MEPDLISWRLQGVGVARESVYISSFNKRL